MKVCNSAQNPWHAIAVVWKANGCLAVKALSGRRFLLGEVLALPLPNCTSAGNCQCRYQKYADRRAGSRREANESRLVWSVSPVGTNKRLGRGRSTSHAD